MMPVAMSCLSITIIFYRLRKRMVIKSITKNKMIITHRRNIARQNQKKQREKSVGMRWIGIKG